MALNSVSHHLKSSNSRSSSKLFLFIFGVLFIAGGITAGVLIDKSSVLNPDKPKAGGGDCTVSGCGSDPNYKCVCRESQWNWDGNECTSEWYCEYKPANQVYCDHTICPVGYHCVRPAGASSYCSPDTGGGGIDCTGTPQCPTGTTLTCGAVTPHTYCGISKCDCLSNHFPAQFKFKEDSCYDYDNDLINSTCNTNCTCKPNVSVTPTKIPTRTPTKPPISPTVPPSSCSYFAIDENSGVDSQLVKINIKAFGFPSDSVSLIKTYPCSSGICEFETIDADNSGQLYGISNTKKALYKISKTTGALTLVANLNPGYAFIASSFRKSDNTLWGWAPGKGIYTINTATGALTLKLASTLSYVDGMAWDTTSTNLYLSRTPLRDGSDAHLLKYTPAGGLIATYDVKLPFDTDGLDSMPGQNLLGAYRGGSGTVKVYRVDPIAKTLTDTYQISTSYTNLDSIVACVAN